MISQLYEKTLRRDLFRLAIMTLATVVIWIGLETYRAFTKSQIKSEIRRQIVPLTPSLDLDTMETVNQRLLVEPVNWESLESAPIFPVEAEDEVATESGDLTAPEASPSGS